MSPYSTYVLRSGAEMPVIGLGTWQLTDDTAGAVAAAIERGYRMIDTSGDYGTQPGVGEGVRRSGIDRDQIYLVTKVEETDNAYEATKKNLDELGFDYANLMLIHRPPREGAGVDLWEGLIRAREEGLCSDIGVSNYPVDAIEILAEATGETPAVQQIEWSPFGRSDHMFGYCRDHGVALQAYSPLTRTKRLDDPELAAIAERYGKTPAQVLIRWDLQLGAAPLPKANQIEHMEENIAVFDFELDGKDMAALNEMNERYSALGSLPYA